MTETAKYQAQALSNNAFLQHLPPEEAPPTVVVMHTLDGTDRPNASGRPSAYTGTQGALNPPTLKRKPKSCVASLFAPIPVAATVVSLYAAAFGATSQFSNSNSDFHSHKNAIAWTVLSITSGIVGFLSGAIPALASTYAKKGKTSLPARV